MFGLEKIMLDLMFKKRTVRGTNKIGAFSEIKNSIFLEGKKAPHQLCWRFNLAKII